MGFSLSGAFKKAGNMLFGSSGVSNPYSPVDFNKLYGTDLEAAGNAYNYSGAYDSLMALLNDTTSEKSQMQNLLRDVDTNTKSAYGSTLMDMESRGLVGEGQSSDIAMNALGQVNATGANTKSNIAANYAMANDQAKQNAMSSWTNILASMAESARNRKSNYLTSLAGIQSGAYSGAANLNANTANGGALGVFLNGFADSYGKKVGGGSGFSLAG